VSISMYSSHLALSMVAAVSHCVPTTLGRAGHQAPKFTVKLFNKWIPGAVEEEEAVDRCFHGRGTFVHFLAS
jgi:hypothetical protein